jgi:hypothetical protein
MEKERVAIATGSHGFNGSLFFNGRKYHTLLALY